MKVLLLNMPFVSISRPAIGISILKARLAQEGIECSVGYPNLFLAERIGLDAYHVIDEKISLALFVGEWLFAQHLFAGALNEATYLHTLQHNAGDAASVEVVGKVRAEIGQFLEDCLGRYQVADYDVIGFTSIFQQNIAALAMAKLVKERFPHKITVMGGGNCEGVMGLTMAESFPWIDYIFSGEADHSFPDLVKRLERGDSVAGVRGLIARQDGRATLVGLQDKVHDLDALPDPDFRDYFHELACGPLQGRLQPSLLIESARGCWWGAKQHCTFCGLNGETMTFRAKSATRVVAELERQMTRHGVTRFQAVDNIISHDYFKTLLPMLRERQIGADLFYEVKSNLRRDQVKLLKEAGVFAIQPGVESINSHVLKLMRKGVSALQNIQLLKSCREYGVEAAWNLLYGFPGETAEDYQQTASIIPAIYHLKPPGCVAPIRLDRFSPNYNQAEAFGLTNIRPFAMYNFLYPLPAAEVANLAYFFEYEHADGRQPATYLKETLEKVDVWKANGGGDLVKRYGEKPELLVVDSRPGRPPMLYPFDGIQREIYEFCDEVRSRAAMLEKMTLTCGDGAHHGAALDVFLEQMVSLQLMVREGQQYLSLAVPEVPFQPIHPRYQIKHAVA